MALTALDIQQQSFGTSRHGYDPQEVDVFLERVATEIENFTRALIDAKARIDAAEARAQAAEHQAAQAAQAAQSAQSAQQINAQRIAAQDAKGSAEAAATEQQIAKAFIAAQKSADQIREDSRRESEKAYREAEARARDIVRDALAEKQRILDEVDRLRESSEKFRTEYLSLLNHFSADAKKNLPGIDSFAPDIAAEKKATADANKVLRENDAAFAAPEDFELASESKPAQKPAPAPEQEPDPANTIAYTNDSFAQAASAYESEDEDDEDDFDDDLDIEEID